MLAGGVVVLMAMCAAQVTGIAGRAHRCYVCVPRMSDAVSEVHRMFPGSSPVLHCEDFRHNDSRFIRECPRDHVGCQTETNGSQVTRTCSDVRLNACNTANSVNYCYCSGELCNSATLSTSRAEPSDDEDLTAEGSGAGSHQQSAGTTTTPSITATTTASTSGAPALVASTLFAVLIAVM